MSEQPVEESYFIREFKKTLDPFLVGMMENKTDSLGTDHWKAIQEWRNACVQRAYDRAEKLHQEAVKAGVREVLDEVQDHFKTDNRNMRTATKLGIIDADVIRLCSEIANRYKLNEEEE